MTIGNVCKCIAPILTSLVLAACSGGAHSAVPGAASSSSTQPGSSLRTGNLAVRLRIGAPAGTLASQSASRTPQYISGRTTGMYVSYACTGTCTGNPAPTATGAIYADLSPTSPLCGGSAGAPVTAPYTCTIGLTLQGGYTYALIGAAVNQAPLGSVNGYGTGFCTGGGTVFGSGTCTGNGVAELSIVTGNVPIVTGIVNSLSGTLDPIPTQIVAVSENSATDTYFLQDGVRARPAYGETNIDFEFELGDAAGNLIAATSGCGSPAAPPCEEFADAFGGNSSAPVLFNGTGASLTSGSPYITPSEDAIKVTSNYTSPLGTFDYAADVWPASCSSCFSGNSGNSSTIYLGTALPAPAIYTESYVWDGTPAADNPPGCTGQACYGVPMLVFLHTNTPCTFGYNGCGQQFLPLIYTPGETCTQASCGYTSGYPAYIAPFEVNLSCGSNPTCGTTFSQGTNQANAAQGGTLKLDAYLYHSGFSNGGYNSPCYPTTGSPPSSTSVAQSCLTIATNGQSSPGGTPPTACYQLINTFAGTCNVASSATPGLYYCYAPGAPNNGTAANAIASIQFNSFTEGKQENQFSTTGNLGVADWANFTITLLSSTGTCSFQVQNARAPAPSIATSAIITISPSGSGSTPINVTIPTPSPIL
jgi:hypothetical protein